MKLFLALSLITISLTAIGRHLWQQTAAAMATCQDQAIINLQTDLNWILAEQPDQTALCQRARDQYGQLTQCYQAVTRRYLIPPALVENYYLNRLPNYPSLQRNQAFLTRACPP